MKELYDNYHENSLSLAGGQALDATDFERARRKFAYNFDPLIESYASDARILDLGCGVGQFLYYLRKRGFTNITGIDISESQVRLARTMNPNADIQAVEDSQDYLSSRKEYFDLIILNDVLEHIPVSDLIPFTATLFQALRTNGTLVVKTVNAGYPLGCSARYSDLTHTIAFHERSLTHLFKHTGFSSIQCFQEEIGLYNPLFFLKKLAVWCTRFYLRVLVYFSEGGWPGIISTNIICTAVKK